MTDLLPKLDALNDLLKTLRQGKVDAEDMVLRGGDEYWEGQAEAYGKAIRGIESACAAIAPQPMTDLLPPHDGQEDCITLEPGMAYISPEQVGHWYSPAAVARMIEEARREERETCIQALAMRCEKYALIGCDDSENVVSECIHIIKGMGEK